MPPTPDGAFTLHLLGTGAALSDPHRTTTMLAFTASPSTLVVDCGGDVVQRLMAAGIDLATIDALIITHEHPDHVSGFPLFMEKIWLSGRRRPIPVCGIAPALRQARRCFETFATDSWEGLPEIQWHEVAYESETTVWADARWRIQASPVVHGVPNVGLRVEHRPTGKIVAYSCDTEPAEAVEHLARGADVLVHEATGATPGHSSPEAAAQAAARSGAGRLLLVHLPPGLNEDGLRDARAVYSPTALGTEGGSYEV